MSKVEIQKSTPRSVLILGNGFDLDLGLETSYKSFAKSPEWPFKSIYSYKEGTLPNFLNSHMGKVDTWFDLEELLAIYAGQSIQRNESEVFQAKQDFSTLSLSLAKYLKKQEEEFVKKINSDVHAKPASSASVVLQSFLLKPIQSIYTFNYTNALRIANQVILNCKAKFCHVHGALKDNNIILGAGDQRVINDDFFSFYKSASPLYKSSNLVEDLYNADEVIIFGHSLGRNDHDYFSEFFQMACKIRQRPFASEKIKIRIFTYDDDSEMEIRKQLMTLTEHHLIGLYAHCDFKIYKTKKGTDWMSDDVI